MFIHIISCLRQRVGGRSIAKLRSIFARQHAQSETHLPLILCCYIHILPPKSLKKNIRYLANEEKDNSIVVTGTDLPKKNGWVGILTLKIWL